MKEYWNFTDEASVPAAFSEIEGGSGSVSITSGHLRITPGGTTADDYAAAVYNTALDASKLTIVYGEMKATGQVGAWVPNVIGLMDSAAAPAAMSAANRDAGLRIWHEYQMSSGADEFDRIQLKMKNESDSVNWTYVDDTDTWQAAFANTFDHFAESSYYRFVLIFDGTTSPKRARGLVYGMSLGGRDYNWNLAYDSSWRDLATGSGNIDPIDNSLWVVLGDPTNDETKVNTVFDFRRVMIGEVDPTELDEISFTNCSPELFANFNYELFKWLNPMPDAQTMWVAREQFSGSASAYTPDISRGSDVYVKDPYCFYDGTTYWLFYQRRVAGPGDGKIQVSSTTDILNGSWASETDISTTGAGEAKHEFPWVTKYGGTWYMFYGVEFDATDWKIYYKTTTQTNPTSGWSSATAVLEAGAAGKFDDGGVSVPVLVWQSGTFAGGTWYLFYNGNDGGVIWKTGLAKSTTGILGTYTRVNDTTPILLSQTGASTTLDGFHADTRILTVASTTDFNEGQKVYIDSPRRVTEVLSVDSGTQLTIAVELNAGTDNSVIRDWYYYSNVVTHPRYINGTWYLWATQFKFPVGEEYIGVWIDTSGEADLADCTFRPLRVGDGLDYVFTEFPSTLEESNENFGPVVQALTEPINSGRLPPKALRPIRQDQSRLIAALQL